MNLFRKRTFREIVVGQHPGQHCAKLVRGALSRRSPGVGRVGFAKAPQRAPGRVCETGYAIRDNYPVTQLHTLVIPKRHAATFFDLLEPERRAINQLLDNLRAEIITKDASVSGFNIGMISGDTAGQTIGHAHVHLIPCRQGDVQNPRGGVRSVIPGKASY